LSRHESFCPGSAQIPFILTKNTVSAFKMRLTIVTVHEKSRERNKKNHSRVKKETAEMKGMAQVSPKGL
jgi:hypothetical protein